MVAEAGLISGYENYCSAQRHCRSADDSVFVLLQQGEDFSRLTLVLTIILYIFLTFLVRELWKQLLRKQMETGTTGSL